MLQRNTEVHMTALRKILNQVQALRREIERRLAPAGHGSPRVKPDFATGKPASPAGTGGIRRVPAFGSNPGSLRMYVHAPERLQGRPPLVVALHGCGQNAADYELGSGWSTLADAHGFVVVYPEQQSSNNPNTCFTWFQPGDTARDGGEALSIHQMVEHAITTYGCDRRKVFVTGLSAGGAMASVMLATYPEVYAGGAIIAGLAYGSAGSMQEAMQAMFMEQSPSTRALGDRVRAASHHRGPWPRVSVWHGTNDQTVKPSNAEHSVRQWANVHGLGDEHSYEDKIGEHTRRVWNGANGTTLIEAITIGGMAHGVPLKVASAVGWQGGSEGCGAVGPFFLDVGVSSTHHIAHFWGLATAAARAGSGTAKDHAREGRTVVSRAEVRATEGAAQAISARMIPADASSERESAYSAGSTSNPQRVISAAFKAAGLPAPEWSQRSNGTPGRVEPGPIIDAALKAAGLRR